MAYLKYGLGRISYSTPSSSPNFIVSGIVDSSCGPEKPRQITSISELDLYFNKEFSDRDYYIELLNSGMGLFLGRPVNTERNLSFDGEYIDYHEYPIVQVNSESDFPDFSVILLSQGSYWIWKLDKWEKIGETPVYELDWSGKTDTFEILLDHPNHAVYLGEECSLFSEVTGDLGRSKTPLDIIWQLPNSEQYIWVTEYGWTNIQHLPQNLRKEEYYLDYVNRDTLKIYSEDSGVHYNHPRFENNNGYIFSKLQVSSVTDTDLVEIREGLKSIGFTFDLSGVRYFLDRNYIVVPYVEEGVERLSIFYFADQIPISSTVIGSNIRSFKIIEESNEEIKDRIREILVTELGYIKLSDTLWYYPLPLKLYHFFELPGLVYEENKDLNIRVIDSLVSHDPGLTFISKNIGPNQDPVTVTIEKFKFYKNKYQITLEKGSYQEVYEGTSKIELDEDGKLQFLPDIINNSSLLVSCRCDSGYWEWLTGTWELDGGTNLESMSTDNYLAGLDLLRQSDREEDFLLIPRVSDFGVAGNNLYKIFLDYAETKNCQVLIQNTEENYKYNYTQDDTNRLVYFYGTLKYGGWERPGYYLFLNSIYTNNLTLSSNSIEYYPPLPPYYEDGEDSEFEKYKCNFLVDNGSLYYYRKLYNHPGTGRYRNSITNRFAMSHITRELQNNKWRFIGTTNIATAKQNLYKIVENSVLRFSNIYDDIEVSQFQSDSAHGYLYIELLISTHELLDSDITLDITINYNNEI